MNHCGDWHATLTIVQLTIEVKLLFQSNFLNMRKIKRFFVGNSVERLSTPQMQSILGSSDAKSYHYYLRCNQDYSDGIDVSDCTAATKELHCGKYANSVCVRTYY